MKQICLLLMLGAFAFTAMAQDTSQTSSSSGQTSAKTSKSKSSGDHSGMAMNQDQSSMQSGKEATLTGCVSPSPDANGNYTLSNSKHKKGVAIGPADKVKDHAGHEVALTGKWSAAPGAEGATAAAGKEKGSRMFEVDNVKHISPTCSEAPGGGTTGTKGKSKGTGDTSSNPKGF